MSAPIQVTKMSGAGNDFIVLDAGEATRLGEHLEGWTRAVCRRGLSIGSDGVLVVGPGPGGHVRVSFLNPDGSPAFCGNGSRCAARYALRRGWAAEAMTLETVAGPLPARVDGERVHLTLPPPRDNGELALDAGGRTLEGRAVDSGVPHFVVFVPAVETAPLKQWGPELCHHPRHGERGANVDLVAEAGPGRLALRTWERGVEGETLACGSGAVAAAFAAGIRAGDVTRNWEVVPASGVLLEVSFEGPVERPDATLLVGDARFVFEAEVDPEADYSSK